MGKAAVAYAGQGYLFEDIREGVSKMRKQPEKPENTITFPGITKKEQQARERIRQRRESGVKAPATPQQGVPEAPPATPEPAAARTQPPERPTTAPRHQPLASTPHPAQAAMSGPDRLVTALIGACGLAAAGMSVYHGYQYLLSVGKPSWVALITAVVMVVFSSTIFAFPFKGHRLFGCALRVLGLATVSFSIFSAVAVNYDQFTAQEEAETSVVRTNEAKRGELDLLHVQLEGLEAQIEDLKRETAYWKDKSWARRDAADAALQRAYADRSALWQGIQAATDAAYQVVEVETIFRYLAGLFRLKERLLEFILFCIPAVFYDVLATLALNTVFGVIKKRK